MDYKPSFLFKNGHINTCFPTIFRNIEVKYRRERINTPDLDFLDIDWIKRGSNNVIVLCHGLEGSSRSKYIQGMAKYFSERGWDILAMNYRGCSGEANKKIKFYNMGQIEDLEEVLKKTSDYKKVVIAGFSLGGGLVLNYLGSRKELPKNLYCAMAVSAPCDPLGSARTFLKKENKIYTKYFMDKLKKKIVEKSTIYPDKINVDTVLKCQTIEEFDNVFTAPQYGYRDALDYYERVSPKKSIPFIKIATLILMAEDDPIMSESCYPIKEARRNKYITLQITKYGGHVGYARFFGEHYWLEERLFSYVESKK